MKRLVIRQEAEIELREAVDYYEKRLAGLGGRFFDEVESCFYSIQGSPSRFPFHKRTPVQRCLARQFPYVIFFQVLDDRISILAVAHAKRRPDYWARRI